MIDRTNLAKRDARDGPNRLSGPPLIVQFIGLVVGALIAAQMVTLALTLVLPPAPPPEYALADIAAALRGDVAAGRFERTMQSGPPDLTTRGWFVSERSRGKLADLLDRPVGEVALGFYTQLPVGGSIDATGRPDRLPDDAERVRDERDSVSSYGPSNDAGQEMTPVAFATGDGGQPRLMNAALFQQMPGAPPRWRVSRRRSSRRWLSGRRAAQWGLPPITPTVTPPVTPTASATRAPAPRVPTIRASPIRAAACRAAARFVTGVAGRRSGTGRRWCEPVRSRWPGPARPRPRPDRSADPGRTPAPAVPRSGRTDAAATGRRYTKRRADGAAFGIGTIHSSG